MNSPHTNKYRAGKHCGSKWWQKNNFSWRNVVKTFAIVATACALLAGTANAEQFSGTAPPNPPLVELAHGRGGSGNGGNGGGGGWGRGSGVGVVIDVPMTGAGYGNVSRPRYDHCSEVRNICFESWGVDGRRYGRCMWRLGC
jgi:hypothetical protein